MAEAGSKSIIGFAARRSITTKTGDEDDADEQRDRASPARPSLPSAPWLRPKTSAPTATAKVTTPGRSRSREASGSGASSGVARRVRAIVDQRQRHVDEEDEPPVDRGQQPAEHRAEGGEEGRGAGEDPERRPLLLVRVDGADDRQRRRHHQRRPDALQGAGGDRPARCSGRRPSPSSRGRRRPRRRGRRAASRRGRRAGRRRPSAPPAAGCWRSSATATCETEPPQRLDRVGAASGTAVWSTRIIELASVIAASVSRISRVEAISAERVKPTIAIH